MVTDDGNRGSAGWPVGQPAYPVPHLDCRRDRPRFAETAAAPQEITEMRAVRGQTGRQDHRLDIRLASLLATAGAAIARHDYGAADRALDEAERIDARDRAVVQTRNELLEAAVRPTRPGSRNWSFSIGHPDQVGSKGADRGMPLTEHGLQIGLHRRTAARATSKQAGWLLADLA